MSLEKKKKFTHKVYRQIASYKACMNLLRAFFSMYTLFSKASITIGGNDLGSSKLIGQFFFASFIGGFASGLRDRSCVILLFLLIPGLSLRFEVATCLTQLELGVCVKCQKRSFHFSFVLSLCLFFFYF